MTTGASSWLALVHGRRAAYTVLLTLGIGVHAIGLFIVATVLPSVVADIGGTAFYTWVTMLYTMASIVGTACGGLVKAKLGFRRGYVLGTLVVFIGVCGCAMTPTMAVLLVARTVQGFGSGLLIALAYSMVSELYPASLRARILSAISGMWGIAALVGPLLGGLFATNGWWRGAFWVFTPVLLLLSALAWYVLPQTNIAAQGQRFPLLRLLLLGAGVLCVAFSGHINALEGRLGLIGSAALCVGSTFYLDAQAAQRLFPTRPLSLATPVGTAYWIFFLFGMTTSQVTVYLPLIIQILYGMSPLTAGYVAALLSVAWTTMALGSAGLQDGRVRRAIVLGPPVMTCGVFALYTSMTYGGLLLMGSSIALTGAGIGLCFAHISSWTITAARPGEESITASAIPTMQVLGIAFGAALAGFVANAAGLAKGVSPTTMALAAHRIYLVSMLAPAILTLLSWRLVQHHKERLAATRESPARP